MTARLIHCTAVNLRGDYWLWWPDAPFGALGDYASRKDAKEAMRVFRAARKVALSNSPRNSPSFSGELR